MAVISAFWRQRQEDWELRVTLGYIASFETLFQKQANKQIFLWFLQVVLKKLNNTDTDN